MRLYTFTNFYLSSIQNGIQTAHCLHEMFTSYPQTLESSSPTKNLYDWAENHKTIIVLNGGDSQSLFELFTEIKPYAEAHGYPYAAFYEDKRSLNTTLTCIGIVLPESVYDIDDIDVDNICQLIQTVDEDHIKLKQIISRFGLAR